MNNDELKKKIAQIIADYFCPQRNEHKNLWGDDRLCYSKTNFAECERVAECTDALIATGIGDVSKYKKHRVFVEKSPTPTDDYYVLPNTPPRIKQLYDGEEVEQIVKEREEYKHRAEVAEWALKDRAAYCATYCVMEGTDYFSLTSVAIEARAKELYKSWRRKAEKELSEENGGKKKV